jgi:hypothetical protein
MQTALDPYQKQILKASRFLEGGRSTCYYDVRSSQSTHLTWWVAR